MKTLLQVWRHLRTAEFLSPAAFVGRAIMLAGLYAVSRLAGLQEYTSFLSGTTASPHVSLRTAAVLGIIHLLLHVGFILLVPIFLIAAALLASWNRWMSKREL